MIGKMTKKYKGKYRVDTTRAKHWNYGWNGAYFVTLNSLNRVRHFGKIKNQTMTLSEIRQIAQNCWEEIPGHFPFVKLGAFVIMPDHVHGIIIIDKKDKKPEEYITHPKDRENVGNRFGPQSRNLASIIRGFKVGVTKNARKINPSFAWQPRYHDRIIRDQQAHERIENYIINNPKNWKEKT